MKYAVVISSRLGFERLMALGHMGSMVDHKVTKERDRSSRGYTRTFLINLSSVIQIHTFITTQQDTPSTITLHHHVTIQAHAKIVHIV